MSHRELTFEIVELCPLCGSPHHTLHDTGNDTLVDEINRYLTHGQKTFPPIVNHRRCCKNCTFIFLSPRLSYRSLNSLYDSWYSTVYRRVLSDQVHIKERLKEFKKYHLKMLNRFAQQRGKLLDVGCGSGLFMRLARTAGWRVQGIELSREAVHTGRTQYGLEIWPDTLKDALDPAKRFQAITLFDFLEHTMSPGDDLDLLIDCLTPGGVLMIRVPNQDSLQSRVMGARWLAVIANHLSYFTPKVLLEALQTRGLRIETLYASNYQNEVEIILKRCRWIGHRLASINSCKKGKLSNAEQSFGPRHDPPFSIMLRRLLLSFLIEQIDHIGGWFGMSNNLMVIARKD